VVCAGALVNPGDVVIADDDGVVLVPAADAPSRRRGRRGPRGQRAGDKRARLAAGVLGPGHVQDARPLAQAGLRYID
jgi:4-hydroxy-4-methyl-2-oxoglutarate aldolase